MYAIECRRSLNLLDIRWSGCFAPATVESYAVDVARVFAAHGFRPGYLLCMDMTDSAVQPQQALGSFRRCFAGFPPARRIAIVTPSKLAEMQVRREMPQPYLRLFAVRDTAMAWLLERECVPA